jgi:hypothetical protein
MMSDVINKIFAGRDTAALTWIPAAITAIFTVKGLVARCNAQFAVEPRSAEDAHRQWDESTEALDAALSRHAANGAGGRAAAASACRRARDSQGQAGGRAARVLDCPCARRPGHPAVGAREPAARSNKGKGRGRKIMLASG